MKLEYQLTYLDYQLAHRWHTQNHPKLLWPYRRTQVIAFATSSLGLLLLVVRPDGGGFVGPLIITAIGFYLGLRLTMAGSKTPDESATRLLLPITLEVTPEIIHETSALWEFSLKWEIYLSWAESPDAFLLYSTNTQYRIIPRCAFGRQEEIVEFRQLLDDKTSRPKAFPVVPLR